MIRKTIFLFCLSTLLIGGFLILGNFSLQQAQPQESREDAARKRAIEKWAEIFEPSVLSKEDRLKELAWFAQASKNLRGVKVKSSAENIETHYWESRVLAKAFQEITGIVVDHAIIGEGELVDRIKEHIEDGKLHHDIYVNDSDLIGWHTRNDAVVNLTEYMKGEGKNYTNPMLDLKDFLNLEFGQDYDGNQLQLPDQQFANLYWFRYDWFTRDDLKQQFKAKYGYELGVPLNWAAYEDIAEFFTNTKVDGRTVYGHVDYAKPSAALGWRFTDAWLSIAGLGDKGLPNGVPVDEWGIRAENRIPVGSSTSRGGEINGPSAVYALTKYLEWFRKYAPPEASGWEWADSGPVTARGDIAQQMFMYITWLSDKRYHSPDSPVCDKFGKPLWRVAPTPHGRYWDDGMKVGYQDAGSWTIPKTTKGDVRAAAWLWAQFNVSKSVDLKKFLVGGTPIRKSTINHEYLTDRAEDYGGLIEFYRSPDMIMWTPSGLNVPYYPGLAPLWWKNIAKAITGELTPQQAMDKLAREQDEVMAKVKLAKYSPKLNKEESAGEWIKRSGGKSPKAERKEREKPMTIDYDELVKKWKQ